jgi:3-hydroxyisobutyrate dehydrogenase-like beta-hydroxyacid dehydrogenase
MAPVGIIGLGNMGGRIARRLLSGGEEVVGYDTSAAALEASGAARAGSIGELVEAADVVLLSLPDSPVVEVVVLGDGGVLARCRRTQVVVDLSTASPASTVTIHAALAERGVEYVDAGISGGAKAAEKGTLTIMAGGSAKALERVRPVLGHFAERVFHMGASGAGHTAKLLNNYLNGVSLAATSEVMVAARRAGLDLAQLLEVINASSGVNFATLERFPHIVKGDYLEGGLTVDLMAKDILLYLDLLRDLKLTSLTGSGTLGCFSLASSLGYGEEISNRVVDALGDIAGGLRVTES